MKTVQIAFLAFAAIVNSSANAQNGALLLDNDNVSHRWETDSANRKPCFLITPYKPVYFLLGNYTNNTNSAPQSFNPVYTVPDSNTIPLNQTEFKFQISMKFKVLQNIFWGHGDLWAAYTQNSHWQLYNAKLSRAFRETNYEPEFILNFPVNYKVFGIHAHMLGLSLTHQSNGRNIPLSRSWNRIIFHAGFERPQWQIMAKAWYRIPDEEDENPQITSYTGRGELLIAHSFKHHQISVQLRNNLQVQNNRGSVLIDWSIPISGHLKGYIQLFNGYGESMIDYNHSQTTIGAGVSLINWL